jgi:DNA polymerase-3 subunit gamma/tau
MLSTAAFNAFLKTLEEPPAHAIFILATTEKHKIIPTILSRCQIYNFSRIRITDTVLYLKYVAGEENVTYDEAALNVIAQKADGAMRDALSIFDQVVSYCGGDITYSGTIENLNVLDYDYYFRLVEAFLTGDVSQSLLIFNDILSKGFDAQYFISGLSSHLRDILVCHDPVTAQLLEVGDVIAEQYKALAVKCSSPFIYKALELANECDLNYRLSKNKRLLVEILLIRLCGLISGGVDSKKDKPELPKMATASAPAENNIAAEHNQARNATVSTNAPQPVSTVKPTVNSTQGSGVSASAKLTSISVNLQNTSEHPHTTKESADGAKSQTLQEPNAEYKAVEQKERNEEFSSEQLLNAWLAYANGLEKEAHTTQTMRNFTPVKVSRNNIVMTIANSTQKESMQTHKRNIERYLANRLHNDFIELNIEMSEKEFENEAFTPTEKLAKMQDKNKYFKELKQRLGLEL